MVNIEEKTAEVNKNFTVFKKLLPSIDLRHSGKFAVLRKEKIIDYFDSMPDAAKYAAALYEDGLYSIQEVNARVIDLGIFSRIGTDTSVSTLGTISSLQAVIAPSGLAVSDRLSIHI